MKLYSALQIGDYHLNHCEDYLFVGEIGRNKLLCAVMDGCTNGIDSYFAATLVGKLLRKIAKEKGYQELYKPTRETDLEHYLKSILKALFHELCMAQNQLLLDQKELLTTLIIALLDKSSNTGIVLAIGDGLVSINGRIIAYDQDNKPDYLGFHLSEDFESWYADQQQKISFHNIQNIAITTDGIFMFRKIRQVDSAETIDPIGFLLTDTITNAAEDALERKLKQLEHIYGLKPTDDLAIIRIIQ
jgi:hypothetical protein